VSYGDGSLEVAGSIVGSTCTGPSHAYAASGTYTVTVSVTDDDGGTRSAMTSHEVVFNVFNFGGFSGPVDNPPLLNLMNSGAAVPIIFTLGGDKGLAVMAPGYPTSQEVTCDAGDPVDTVEVTVSAAKSSLAYDPSTGQYTYVWKTKRSWFGTCRLFTLRLVDGTDHEALFMFTK
jgi:PKD repeat protein